MKADAWLDLHGADDLRYALAKQLAMRAAVEKALSPLLERRLATLEKVAAQRTAGEFSHEKTRPQP